MKLLVFVLAFLIALVAMSPASIAAKAIEWVSGGKLQTRDPKGSLWDGSARVYLDRGELGTLAWKVRPAALLGGKLAVDAVLERSRARLELSPWSVGVRDLELELPAAALGLADPALQAMGPRGTVRIRSEQLRLESGAVLGLAEVHWRDVRIARARGLALGSHVARLRGGGERVDIELASLSGPLELQGEGTWSTNGAVRLAGSAQAREREVADFLRSVCAESRGPRCFFRYSRNAAL